MVGRSGPACAVARRWSERSFSTLLARKGAFLWGGGGEVRGGPRGARGDQLRAGHGQDPRHQAGRRSGHWRASQAAFGPLSFWAPGGLATTMVQRVEYRGFQTLICLHFIFLLLLFFFSSFSRDLWGGGAQSHFPGSDEQDPRVRRS